MHLILKFTAFMVYVLITYQYLMHEFDAAVGKTLLPDLCIYLS